MRLFPGLYKVPIIVCIGKIYHNIRLNMNRIMPENTKGRKTFFDSELLSFWHFFTRSLALPLLLKNWLLENLDGGINFKCL